MMHPVPGATPLDKPHQLTHWGRVTHVCVGKLIIIDSDNGLSPGRRQAIIWTNARILLISTIGTNFSEILSEINIFSFKKMHLKMSSAKERPFCLSLNVLNHRYTAVTLLVHPTSSAGSTVPVRASSCWRWVGSVHDPGEPQRHKSR